MKIHENWKDADYTPHDAPGVARCLMCYEVKDRSNFNLNLAVDTGISLVCAYCESPEGKEALAARNRIDTTGSMM